MNDLQAARQLWQQLEIIFGDERIWEPMGRLRAVLLSAEGKTPGEIAREVGKNIATIRGWLRDFETAGLKGLFPLAEGEGEIKRSAQIFANLLVARLAEDLFQYLISPQLASLGLKCEDRRSEYTEADFGVLDHEGHETFLVNVKVHSSRFEQAAHFVNLDADDTFPLALYKILMGFKYQRESGIPFLFVVSVRWGIVDQVVEHVQPEDRKLINLVFRVRARGKRKAEDRLVDTLVEKLRKSSSWKMLLDLLERQGQHVVLSAQKALSIFMDKFEDRCPALTLGRFAAKFAGRRGVPAEINMHYSIANEMTPLTEFLRVLRQEGVPGLQAAVERREI